MEVAVWERDFEGVLDVTTRGDGEKAVIVKRAFEKDQIVCELKFHQVVPAAFAHSLQIDEDTHVLLGNELNFMNHSCDPSVFIDCEKRELRALRTLKDGDEVTFFYPSTEWNMGAPFKCSCGGGSCLGMVSGAQHLDVTQLKFFEINQYIIRLKQTQHSPSS